MVNIKCGNKVFRNIQAILFDKNGTLEDSETFLRSHAQRSARIVDAQVPGIGESLLMSYGVNSEHLDPAGLMSVASRYDTEVATAAYIAETGKSWFESLQIARKALDEAENYLGETASPMFAGSWELLKSLSEIGLKLGILSAAPSDEVENFVKVHQLGSYLELEMGVDGQIGKPNPKFFLQACERLGVEASVTLMVGDSVGDMIMGKNAGAAGCIGISWVGKFENVRGADVFIKRLDEIELVSSQ
ncbi:HAD family hydrolase [Brunnivagina elsteri]|uniref:HAD family hydrolase n=1 Tax=Brunnivagina elsteri CCALA 953 TaxID=987040 RepID=A0A2A2TI90_9CYAN|nr:HAD family hydrolase [Calothrix elsteri]PAX53355.1 HAD family hydrolase [Calothrix elsteri CCALA 953]